MARNKRKKDAANGTAGPGHNTQLTDDERRALTLHHKRLYEAADAKVELAKTGRTAVSDLAKSDLGKGALADIKEMIADGDEVKAKAKIERALRLARWAGMPVGTEVNLFDVPVDDRAAAEGMTAGMAGDDCKPPVHFSAQASQRWIENWHEGQKVLQAAFAKKRGDVKSEPPAEKAAEAFGDPVDLTEDEKTQGYTHAFVKDGNRVAMHLPN